MFNKFVYYVCSRLQHREHIPLITEWKRREKSTEKMYNSANQQYNKTIYKIFHQFKPKTSLKMCSIRLPEKLFVRVV